MTGRMAWNPHIRPLQTNSYRVEDCAGFVILNVLPQLNARIHGQPFAAAQALLWQFLESFDVMLEVCSDAPQWGWNLFCDLAYVNHRWPVHLADRPTNLVELFNQLNADSLDAVELNSSTYRAE